MQRSTIEELLEDLRGGGQTAITAAARGLARRGAVESAPSLREVLMSTTDAMVRNAVAIALSDLRDGETFHLLVALLESSKTKGARGTLLYALQTYDCTPILPLLVDCVIDGGFEEAREAMSLIAGIEAALDDETWRACNERLRAAVGVAAEERRPLVEELLASFQE